jgi:hypothetical protein
MEAQELNTASDEIRTLSSGKKRVHWPREFKEAVLSALDTGVPLKEASKVVLLATSNSKNLRLASLFEFKRWRMVGFSA